MLTKDLIEIICNDRHSLRTENFRVWSLFVIAGLCLASLFLLNALQFQRLFELINQRYVQYTLCCLLLLYVCSAKLLVALSRPGQVRVPDVVALLLFLLLFWLPVFFSSTFEKVGIRCQALPVTYWLSHSFVLVLLGLPWLYLLMKYLRSMAPTRLALTGALAGFVSCTLATVLSLLSGKEQIVNFYIYTASLSMVFLSLIGALIGSRFLRW